jgi:hypothetical protein
MYELRFEWDFKLFSLFLLPMRNIEIYINRTKAVLFTALFMFMVCSDLYLIAIHPEFLAEGVFGIFLFGALLAYSVSLFVRKEPTVLLSQAGINYKGWRGLIVYWDNIEYVEVRRIGRNKFVQVHIKSTEGMINPNKKNYLIGTKMLMINSYELCELLQLLASVKSEKRQEIIDGILAGVDLSLINIR